MRAKYANRNLQTDWQGIETGLQKTKFGLMDQSMLKTCSMELYTNRSNNRQTAITLSVNKTPILKSFVFICNELLL